MVGLLVKGNILNSHSLIIKLNLFPNIHILIQTLHIYGDINNLGDSGKRATQQGKRGTITNRDLGK